MHYFLLIQLSQNIYRSRKIYFYISNCTNNLFYCYFNYNKYYNKIFIIIRKGYSRNERRKKKYSGKGPKNAKKIIKKICNVFIMCYLFSIFFWYYLSCFCVVYKNTQLHLIKDTLISFCLSLIYPLFINLLPGIFRIIAINSPKKEQKCLFFISKILQLI